MKVVPEAVVPLYQQLKIHLNELIKSGQLKSGERLPSEKELEEQFGVSRITVRRALQELAGEEKILRVPGKGSFVLKPKIEPLTALTSFSENMRAQGFKPSYRNAQIKIVKPPAKVASVFEKYGEERALNLHRILLADDEPMAIQDAYLPHFVYQRDPLIFTPETFNVTSLYSALELRLGIPLVRAEESVEASIASPQEAKQLNIQTGDLILVINRITYSSDSNPIEYVNLIFRADRYRYRVELFRPPKKVS